jgi:hypothetical protein
MSSNRSWKNCKEWSPWRELDKLKCWERWSDKIDIRPAAT